MVGIDYSSNDSGQTSEINMYGLKLLDYIFLHVACRQCKTLRVRSIGLHTGSRFGCYS
jgi:hypothetical protein